MSILRFPKIPRTRSCKICRANLSLHPASHKLCRRCWADGRELVVAMQPELPLIGGGSAR